MSQSEAVQASQASHPGSRPSSRTGSRVGSAAASRPGINLDWQEDVQWDGVFRPLNDAAYDGLPEAEKLRELVKKSFIVPEWMANIESHEMAFYHKMRHVGANVWDLSHAASRPVFTKDNDDRELSLDVNESFTSILQLPDHSLALQSHLNLEPAEADRRYPVDTLGSLVWDLQSEGLLVYRTERKLKIPRVPEQAGDVQPDACAFIVLPPSIQTVQPKSWAALSCFPSSASTSGLDHCYALHWVTEFKRDGNEALSKCQVVEGLVSALYQRRAFGCPNHFVFGTAHYSRTTLEVLAATWVPTDEPANPEARLQDTTMSAVPGEDQTNDPSGNSSRNANTASAAPKIGEEAAGVVTNLTVKEVMKYNKIVVYSIATYKMTVTEDILQLYLLMRQTRVLAQQYKEEITKDAFIRILALFDEAKELYQPPPPRPKSDSARKKRKYTSSLPPTREVKAKCIDSEDDFDSSSDLEELESLSSGGPTGRIVGDVASYTVKNYAHD
ncbi:hypothetical protein RSOL_396330 [Rhizoctonia solani AG-3 Rhs1AP]|uniref:Uncharacterized protein n=1 Tax=Rhizoctonia solani AG-3 Rhs1AP TaxID=1086054 RepID=X8JBV6_9AGAM|nr:hypothetical protein RSOL_396330 [Rhizoctonia solani AG-3 Rhs1AP]